MKKITLFILVAGLGFTACKKKGCMDEAALNYSKEAKKSDNSCVYGALVNVPTTYLFKDAKGNNTVNYEGQTERLNQLSELSSYMKSGTSHVLDYLQLTNMFENFGGDGGGSFTFTSSKQLKDKCFPVDVSKYEGYMQELTIASADFANEASAGQAGVISSGASTYLFAANGIEYAQLIEKGLMGAVFMYQATHVYFGSDKMNADNTTPEDPGAGKYYTKKEHHWDEAFGYFDAPIDFPTNKDGLRFWAKYCNNTDTRIGSNKKMMNAFLKGRALISQGYSQELIMEQVSIIQKTWEQISAAQAINYLEGARTNFGSDNAKFLHQLSEAYGFILCLKYAPLDSRVITYSEIEELLETTIGNNFWSVTNTDLTNAINKLNAIYKF